MGKMDLYNAVRTPPETALKPIQGGRLRGMSDINPMWRYQQLTEQFGPCGIGWKPEIVKFWIEQGRENEIAAFCQINLYIKIGDQWSEPIPGIGGSAFVTVEKNGPYVSDECYKMAFTDAISVSCKLLGFAADIYWQNGGDSKYARMGEKQADRTTVFPKTRDNTKAAKQEPETSQNYACAICNEPFLEIVYKGRTYTPLEMYEGAIKTHGQAICKVCAGKISKEEKHE